jgi:hypothetical protein
MYAAIPGKHIIAHGNWATPELRMHTDPQTASMLPSLGAARYELVITEDLVANQFVRAAFISNPKFIVAIPYDLLVSDERKFFVTDPASPLSGPMPPVNDKIQSIG